MMTKNSSDNRGQMVMVTLEDLVPQDHLLRSIDARIAFDFIYDLVETCYSPDTGRPSYDPVKLIKIVMIHYLFGIKSMRQTIQELSTNVAYKWFVGIGLNESPPHFSTFSKNYARRFEGTKLFERIFKHILTQIIERGYLEKSAIFIDGTHIKASANKNRHDRVVIRQLTRDYTMNLEAEINVERQIEGLKPLKKNEKAQYKTVKQSPVDRDAGLFWKNERERMYCYNVNTACDKNGYILGAHVASGNTHDSATFEDVAENVFDVLGDDEVEAIVVDAGYLVPRIATYCERKQIKPIMPYKRPMTKKGFFKKSDFIFDPLQHHYTCPKGERLTFHTIDRQGYRRYQSNPKQCQMCDELKRCTHSQNHTKIITRHIWVDALEKANQARLIPENKALYKKRAQTIERCFADAKEKHGMRYTQYRGIEKVTEETMLRFACMNLKKMANWEQRIA